MNSLGNNKGFTLIELIMVIVVLGVVSGIVATFMKIPIDAYLSSGRRAGLTDQVDTVVRRIERDLHRALPNSVNVASSGQCLYLIPTKSGGRYRNNDIIPGDGKGLNFSSADTSFNMLGNISSFPSSQKMISGDLISIYNLGVPGDDVYSGNNVATIGTPVLDSSTSPVETTIPISSFQFPFQSASSRFHIISSAERVVSYVCSGGNLYRYVNSNDFSNACTSLPANAPLLASNLGSCQFSYSTPDLSRSALVGFALNIQDSSKTESISIENYVNINNTP